MNRVDRHRVPVRPRLRPRPALALVLLLVGASAASTGCAGDGERSGDRDLRATPTLGADVAPVPEFEEYMLGDLPSPRAPGRDPFTDVREEAPAPAPRRISPAPPPAAPSLRGIVRSEGRLVALFDGGAAGRGETVSGWRVVEIDVRSVLITRGERRVRRSL